ncbi:MAG: hypothetical protein Q9M34_01450 [Sulfurimonas sp.]|nr:hypothetical protein [Sulfurimonas sp.]
MRLTLDEYSKHFKMSKEMINSKLRSKKLNYIIEDGITYIIVTRSSIDSELRSKIHNDKKVLPAKEKVVTKSIVTSKQKTTVAMVLGLYQKENQQLKEKILQLETKIDKLIDDKEQMLRDEMAKIEQVYSSKDEQLKSILELINAKLQAQTSQTIHEIETIESSQTIEKKEEETIIELKNYLRTLDLENYQKKIIKKRFLAVYGKDIRVIRQNGKLYLNFSKYDYSDLLEY